MDDQHVLGLQGVGDCACVMAGRKGTCPCVGLDGQLVPGLQGVGDSGCVWAGGWRLCL